MESKTHIISADLRNLNPEEIAAMATDFDALPFSDGAEKYAQYKLKEDGLLKTYAEDVNRGIRME